MERNNKIRCDICNKEISKSNWSKHIKTKKHINNNETYEVENRIQKHCGICNILLSENEFYQHLKSNLHKRNTKLIKDEINNIQKYCSICNILVFKNQWNDHLKSITHKNKTKLLQNKLKEKVKSFNIRKQRLRHFNDLDFETDDYIVKKSEEALEGCFLTLRITPKNEVNSVYVLIEELPELMFERMKYILEEKTYKLQIVIKGNFRKFHPATGQEEFEEITVPSKSQIILREDEIEETIHALLLEIHEKIESWDNNEGYWHLDNVINIDFKLREYKPLSGSSYIELPKWIYNKKATINIKNDDQKCFKYCLQYHKHKNEITHHPERVSWYSKWDNDYDFTNIKFPVEVDDIQKFCKQNNISINLYVVNGKSIQPYLTFS